MNWLTIILLVVFCFVVLELIKHLLLKKTAKLVIFLIFLLVLFIFFSNYASDQDEFKDNKFVQTGASIFSDVKENLEEGDIINETIRAKELIKN